MGKTYVFLLIPPLQFKETTNQEERLDSILKSLDFQS